MADLTRWGAAAQRSVETVLRGTGGRAVLLRMPVPGADLEAAEQLGFATVAFSDRELAPVMLRMKGQAAPNRGQSYEMLVAARAAAALAGGEAVEIVLAMFDEAAGVVVDGVQMTIEAVRYEAASGVPTVYRVQLRGPRAAAV